jgi:hypothetical protein
MTPAPPPTAQAAATLGETQALIDGLARAAERLRAQAEEVAATAAAAPAEAPPPAQPAWPGASPQAPSREQPAWPAAPPQQPRRGGILRAIERALRGRQ